MMKKFAGIFLVLAALLAVACTTTTPVTYMAPEPLARK